MIASLRPGAARPTSIEVVRIGVTRCSVRAMRKLVCAALLLAFACNHNPRRDAALERARVARARGDMVGEALALRDACNAAPDDRDLCQRADQAFSAAGERTIEAGRRACTGIAPTLAAVDTCLAAVGEIRKLMPDHPEAARLAEAASRQHLARCLADSPAWQTSIDAAIELVRCEQAREQQIGLPSYSQRVLAARTAARDQIVALADTPAFASKPGATAELVSAAACLTSTPALVSRAETSRRAFLDHAAATIDLRLKSSTPLPRVCDTAASALSDRASCGPRRRTATDGPTITVIGDVELSRVQHEAHETTESKDYVAGIIRFPNPDYQPAVNDERNARQAKDSAEQQAKRDESDCRSAESALSSASSCSSCPERTERDRACNAARTSQSLYDSRTRDWERARRHLDATPSISEREDIRTATYVVTHHTWRAGWSGRLRSDGATIADSGGTTTSDDATAGAPVAGVPADPMTYPGTRWFVGPIRDQVAARIAATVDAGLKRRASDLAVSCPAPLAWTADWLECWARVRLWAGAPPARDALLRAVGETKDARRGPMWDQVGCEH